MSPVDFVFIFVAFFRLLSILLFDIDAEGISSLLFENH